MWTRRETVHGVYFQKGDRSPTSQRIKALLNGDYTCGIGHVRLPSLTPMSYHAVWANVPVDFTVIVTLMMTYIRIIIFVVIVHLYYFHCPHRFCYPVVLHYVCRRQHHHWHCNSFVIITVMIIIFIRAALLPSLSSSSLSSSSSGLFYSGSLL